MWIISHIKWSSHSLAKVPFYPSALCCKSLTLTISKIQYCYILLIEVCTTLSVIQRSLLNVPYQDIFYSYYIHLLACTSESAMLAPCHRWKLNQHEVQLHRVCPFVAFLTCIYTIDTSRPVKFSKSSIAHYITKYFLLPVSTKELFTVEQIEPLKKPSMTCPKCFGNDATKFQQVHSNKRELKFFFSTFCKTLISETFGTKIQRVISMITSQNFPFAVFLSVVSDLIFF